MPITATVSELIVREIVQRLEAFAGDPPDFTVYRETTAPERMTPTTRQVVVKIVSHERLPSLDRLANPPVIAYQLTVGCYGQVMVSELDMEAAEGHALEIAGDIIDAIVTGAGWYTMDSNAINATVGNVSVQSSEAVFVGSVMFPITYRVAETNPFTAAG